MIKSFEQLVEDVKKLSKRTVVVVCAHDEHTLEAVVKAEQEKIAANDMATAVETRADGERRAEIKKAEGVRQGEILRAEGEAQAIKLVNEAANTYFIGNIYIRQKF